MWYKRLKALMLITISINVFGCVQQQKQAREFFQTERQQPMSQQVAVASAHPLATEAGLRILENGGNAFDAAVAVSAALAVVEPTGSGLGGGGFWLLHREVDGKQVMIDGRETAPSAAHKDMYLDEHGNVIKNSSKYGPLAAGIPGLPAGLVHISSKYGKLPLSESLRPAITYAKQGFIASARIKKYLKYFYPRFNDQAKRFFPQPTNDRQLIKQPDLANTLKQLGDSGFDGFYKGDVAKKLVKAVQQNKGVWTLDDLSGYKVIEREPVVFNYRDARIVSASLPSSGGLVMQQALNILQQVQPHSRGKMPDPHLVVESMRRAYRDRALYLGDSDFHSVDRKALTGERYLNELASSIDVTKASQSLGILPDNEQAKPFKQQLRKLGEDTTHFSIIDAQGNRVAGTLSINFPFGSCFMPAGTGLFLNNEMDDFSIKPGEPNGYQLVGNEANAIAPGKRPLSSMSPTFIEQEDEVTLLGTPGGSRIISMLLLGVVGAVDAGMSIKDIVAMPRYHHQFLPDQIQVEKDALLDYRAELQGKGHKIKELNRTYGNMHIVQSRKTDSGVQLHAASDPRGEGAAQVVSSD